MLQMGRVSQEKQSRETQAPFGRDVTCLSCVQQANVGDKTQSLESVCTAGGRAGAQNARPREGERGLQAGTSLGQGLHSSPGPSRGWGSSRADGMAGCVSQTHPTLGCRNAAGRTESDSGCGFAGQAGCGLWS